MPLHDHFHPPLSRRRSWFGVHHTWAVTIVQRLNGGVLSAEFEAEPEIHTGPARSIDVAYYEDENLPSPFVVNSPDAPPAPPITGEVSFTDADVFEIQVYRNAAGWNLVAAIELVSPRNKDRPSARRTFATKVASYLQQGVSVVVVDVVTGRAANLHAELAELLHLPDTFDWQSASGLSAVTYRVVKVKEGDKEQERLDVWPHTLALGESLPTVPLWLTPVLAVPLELEATYEAACKSLRIA
jgi:hypothetical protein